MTGYESKRAAARDKLVVTDLDGHVVRDVQKPKKVAALDRDAEIERLNEKIEFLARTNMLYSDWEHRDTQVTSELIRKGIEEHKINAELRAEIERLKEALAQPAPEPIGYAVPTFDFDNSVIKKVHYSGTVPLYTAPPAAQPAPPQLLAHIKFLEDELLTVIADGHYSPYTTPPQPEQEPVATVQCIHGITIGYLEIMQPVGTKLYTAPPQRPWVGLTDEEVCEICDSYYNRDSELAQMVEAMLKEKNNAA